MRAGGNAMRGKSIFEYPALMNNRSVRMRFLVTLSNLRIVGDFWKETDLREWIGK